MVDADGAVDVPRRRRVGVAGRERVVGRGCARKRDAHGRIAVRVAAGSAGQVAGAQQLRAHATTYADYIPEAETENPLPDLLPRRGKSPNTISRPPR